jgi:hypothetical protein
MAKKTLGEAQKIRVDRVSGNTYNICSGLIIGQAIQEHMFFPIVD